MVRRSSFAFVWLLSAACTAPGDAGKGGSGAFGGSDAEGVPAPHNQAQAGADLVWRAPVCPAVIGTVAVTFSTDGGETLAPVVGPPPDNVTYSRDVATGPRPNLLYAQSNGTLIRSMNGGCDWEDVAAAPDASRLFSAGPDLVYGLGTGGGLFRYSKLGVVQLYDQGPSGYPIESLLVYPDAGSHLLFASDGAVYESMDGGASFDPVSESIGHDRFTFSSPDGQFLAARAFSIEGESLDTSHDRGLTWKKSGIAMGEYLIVDVAISAVDPAVIWTLARRISDQSNTLFYSGDGGASFKAVLIEPDGEPYALNNGVLTASPFETSKVVIVGSKARNSTISTFDAATSALTVHAHPDTLAGRVVFSPAGPSVFYVPLSYVGHTN